MSRLKVIRLVCSLLLFVVGIVLWTSRLPSEPSLARSPGISRLNAMPLRSGDAIEDCPTSQRPNNWNLLFISSEVFADGLPRGYFETDGSGRGMLIRYDPSSRFFGTALLVEVPGLDGAVDFHIQTVRRSQKFVGVIGMSSSSLRIVTNGADRLTKFPANFELDLSCNSVGIGVADGVPCPSCKVSVSYLSGISEESAMEIMDSFSNVSTFRVRSIGGTLLTWLSLVILLTPNRAFARFQARRQDHLAD